MKERITNFVLNLSWWNLISILKERYASWRDIVSCWSDLSTTVSLDFCLLNVFGSGVASMKSSANSPSTSVNRFFKPNVFLELTVIIKCLLHSWAPCSIWFASISVLSHLLATYMTFLLILSVSPICWQYLNEPRSCTSKTRRMTSAHLM